MHRPTVLDQILLGVMVILAVAVAIFAAQFVFAADVGQIPSDVPPAVRDWFGSAKSPRSGSVKCCDLADGHIVPYSADADGVFWVDVLGQHLPVPVDAIVPPPYVLLEGVLWYRIDGYEGEGETYHSKIWIRCFAPGGGA